MTLKQSENEVMLEGILSEIDYRELPQNDNALAGRIVLQCKIRPNPKTKETITSLIPVEFYVAPMTKAGKSNKAYSKIKSLIDNAKTLADGNEPEAATKLRTRAQISENSFVKDGEIITGMKIRSNFYDEVRNNDFEPTANFKVRMVVSAILPEMKTIEGSKQETGDLIVEGFVVNYRGDLEKIRLNVRGKKYVESIEQYWSEMETIKASGFVNFSTEKETYVSDQEEGFGEPIEEKYIRNIKEFIITNGSRGEVDNPYDTDEITEKIKERKRALEEKLAESEKAEADKGW